MTPASKHAPVAAPSWWSRLRRSRRVQQGCAAGLIGIALAALTWWCLPKPDLYPPGLSFSRALLDREGRIIHLTLTTDDKYRLRTPLQEIQPDLIEATLLMEDRHFAHHLGVNPLSMVRSFWGVCTGTRSGGGSTITMQLARLRFGLATRSLPGKAVQMARAVQLERHYPKDAILEAYLNLAPYGGNVEGIGAASLLWCGKSAARLTTRESIALSVIPQSPSRRRPKPGERNSALAAAQFRLWQRWQVNHGQRIDPLDAGFTLQPESGSPQEAPHLARRLLREDGARVASTLDLPLQQTLEETIRTFLQTRHDTGISNACALLVHAPSREVRAYIGSAAFLDARIQGQVDGVRARRSPGSALKPFIYALAMQQGLIHPRSLVRDGRVTFGAYNPENFDRGFSGPIPAEDALFHSRNIPALTLTRQLEEPCLYEFLQRAGVSLPKPQDHYGLALPLGGAEVSLEELAELYALLASDGSPRPIRFVRDAPDRSPPAPLLTPQTCFLTRGMLASRENEEGLNDPSISWKTGTSHGFRDAWAAGIQGDYVIVVWIGNFDGTANPAFVARRCAAPLLFDCFHHLRLPNQPDLAPPGVSLVELCAVSGQLPCPHCRHRRMGWFLPGVSPIKPCEIHRELLLDPRTRRRVAADDGTRPLLREVYEIWPPDVLALFREAGLPRREIPPLEPGQPVAASANARAPQITSPQRSLVYALQLQDPARRSIPLRVDAAAGVRTVFWFAGSSFLGSGAPDSAFLWKPSPGNWEVYVLDDQGRSDSCKVRVKVVE